VVLFTNHAGIVTSFCRRLVAMDINRVGRRWDLFVCVRTHGHMRAHTCAGSGGYCILFPDDFINIFILKTVLNHTLM
jgi:hypothetical protein